MTNSMNAIDKFNQEKLENIEFLGNDVELRKLGLEFINKTAKYQYSYNFNWMGRPIIQFPQDIIAMQEIIWDIQPDLIIETGIAHGGSIIFYASMLELIGKGKIVGVDIDIRHHNRIEIENHKMFKRIQLIEGSSVDESVFSKIKEITKDKETVLVIFDSNHTYEHVFAELNLYSSLVSVGSYCVVFDTVIEDLEEGAFPKRPWGKNNNPKTAVIEFLKNNSNFEVDHTVENKLLITVAPNGYLRRIK